VVRTYNSSYSGGKDQEGHGSNAARGKKRPSQKRAGRVAQGIGPEFRLQNHKKPPKPPKTKSKKVMLIGPA
jgi:hypothetical protein